MEIVDRRTTMPEALRKADEVLQQAVQGITDLINLPALINLDFADVQTVMTDKGIAHIGIGEARGDDKAMEAVQQAVSSPLLETTIKGATHEADILVGTQMIVKGHDFPEVTLVGAVAADLSLNAADFRCSERTFQLLTQAVGRSGRGTVPGEAIIQTYHPEHYSIQAAARQDYQTFYQEEMSYRMMMDYPPAAHMLAILASGENEELLEQGMEYLGRFTERISRKYGVHIIGPAYAAVGKVNDIYRKVIYLKHKDEQVLMEIKQKTEKYIEANSGFRKLYIQMDYS